jgi:hypothetical protein
MGVIVHGPTCPCDSFVEERPHTQNMPCPALWDARWPNRPLEFGHAVWTVKHRIEGSVSTGAKVWSWWECRGETP